MVVYKYSLCILRKYGAYLELWRSIEQASGLLKEHILQKETIIKLSFFKYEPSNLDLPYIIHLHEFIGYIFAGFV